MPASAGRGPLSKAVRNLCDKYGSLSASQFKTELQNLLARFSYLPGNIPQNTGLAFRYWIGQRHANEEKQIWILVDQVEPKIRQAVEPWNGGVRE